jgi:hypothetical protein
VVGYVIGNGVVSVFVIVLYTSTAGLGTFKVVAPAEKLVATTGTEIEPVARVPIVERITTDLTTLLIHFEG